MKLRYSIAIGLPLMSASALAADMTLKFELPQLNVAEYHRPYVAAWLENAEQKVVANLAVLYDVKKKDNGGAKYLKDLRQWWRKAGRDVEMPMDGVSGATRGPGEHTLALPVAKEALNKLPAGQYQLVLEVAREAGGRELVKLPLALPVKAPLTASVKGKEEVGNVTVTVKP